MCDGFEKDINSLHATEKYYEYKDIDLASDRYVLEGGLSGSYLYQTEKDKYNYISEIYRTLIVRDIIKRCKIKGYQIQLSFVIDVVKNRILKVVYFKNGDFEKIKSCFLTLVEKYRPKRWKNYRTLWYKYFDNKELPNNSFGELKKI